jgi:hypothetical protein
LLQAWVSSARRKGRAKEKNRTILGLENKKNETLEIEGWGTRLTIIMLAFELCSAYYLGCVKTSEHSRINN